MNKYILMVCLLMMACTRQELQENAPQMVFHATVEESRTRLDGVRVLWSEDDAIVVNGEASSSVTLSSDRRSAQFTLPVISHPYHALYPASAFVEGSYAPLSSRYGSLNLPARQQWVEGSFDPAAALMCAVSSDTPGLNFSCGVAFLRLEINSSHPHAIRRIEISAIDGEDMSGTMVFDPAEGRLLSSGNDGKGVVVSAAEGIAPGTAVYAAIAAKTYASGIRLRIVDEMNHYEDIRSGKRFDARPAVVYKSSVTFEPDGTLIDAGAGDTDRRDNVTKILFIGNSHTLDATDLLPLMLNHEGVRGVELTRVFHGGYYLVGYNAYYDKPGNASMTWWSPGQRFWNGSTEYNYSLKDIVTQEKYDIVVLQEYAGNPHAWKWDDTERNAIHGLIDKIRVTSPDAEFVFFQSHCWADNYENLLKYFANNVEMFETVVRENTLHVMDPAEAYPFQRMFSTGAMLQNLRTTALNVDNGCDLLRGDGVHLDYGMTRVAASLLVWKTLITPLTGIPIEDISFRFREFYPSPTQYTTPAIDGNWPVLLAAVNAAAADPYHITDMSQYSTVPEYVDVPGSACLDDTGVDVFPVSFPVRFKLTGWGGAGLQFLWRPLGVWMADQAQAFAKWVSVSTPAGSPVYKRSIAETSTGTSCAIGGVWTGDYFEFVFPVKHFKAGTTVRFSAPVYTRRGPCFWYLDYLDGDTWKHNSSEVSTWDGAFTRDATFAVRYGTTNVTADCTFENGIEKGFLRMRLRCAEGTVQAGSTGAVRSDTPFLSGGEHGSVFYFLGGSSISFSIVQ